MPDDELPIRLPRDGLVLYDESQWVERTDASLVLRTRRVANAIEFEWENRWSRGSELVGFLNAGALPKDRESDGEMFFRRSERRGRDVSRKLDPGRYGVTFELRRSRGGFDWLTSRFLKSRWDGEYIFDGCVQFTVDVPAPHEDFIADADARLGLLRRAAEGIQYRKVIDDYQKGRRSPEELLREAVEARRQELAREAALREVDVDDAVAAVRHDVKAREKLRTAGREAGLSEDELEELLDRVFGRDATKA